MANIESWQKHDITVSRYVEDYINDFSEDPDVVSVWRFEDEALLVDSSGNNNTLHVEDQTPTNDLVNFKEGSSSVQLQAASDADCLSIDNASLSDNHPLKYLSEDNTFSLTFWARFDTLPAATGPPGSYWRLCFYQSGCILTGVRNTVNHGGGGINFVIAFYGGGTDPWEPYITHASTVQTGRWYHIAFTYNASDDSYRLRIWDDTARDILGVDKVGTTEIPLPGPQYPLNLGTTYYQDAMDGNLDEMVLFKRVLTVEEIDKIRQGIFP